jgi:hypothetical protein
VPILKGTDTKVTMQVTVFTKRHRVHHQWERLEALVLICDIYFNCYAWSSRMKLFKNSLLGLGLIAMSPFCLAQTPVTANIQGTQQCVKVYGAKVTLPDGTNARVKTRNGEMATITVTPDGRGIGITPSTLDTKPGLVRLEIFNITTDADKKPVAVHAAFVKVAEQGEATYAQGNLSFKIEMLPAAPAISGDKQCKI